MSFNSNSNQNYGAIRQGGYNSTAVNIDFSGGSGFNNNNSDESDSDESTSIDIDTNGQFLDDLNCSLITQIREQSATGRANNDNGPYRSQLQLQQIARSRRRYCILYISEIRGN
jgi:hypothetical protein